MSFTITSERMQVLIGTLGVFCLVAAALIIGQPTVEERLAAQNEVLLEARSVFIHSAELLDLLHSEDFFVVMLDVRSQTDYDQFHIAGAEHISTDGILETVLDMNAARYVPHETAFVVMSNDETAATEAWRLLAVEEKLHVYILDGGINGWINTFADAEFRETHVADVWEDDELGCEFEAPSGEDHPLANPDPQDFNIGYDIKVHFDTEGEPADAPAPSTGGCG